MRQQDESLINIYDQIKHLQIKENNIEKLKILVQNKNEQLMKNRKNSPFVLN